MYFVHVFQLANMTRLVSTTIATFNRSKVNNFTGLAIIDWEDWREIFTRNFNRLSVYQKESRKLVIKEFPQYQNDSAMVEKLAVQQFEAAAK